MNGGSKKKKMEFSCQKRLDEIAKIKQANDTEHSQKIYINENLSRYNRKLAYYVRKLKKDNKLVKYNIEHCRIKYNISLVTS